MLCCLTGMDCHLQLCRMQGRAEDGRLCMRVLSGTWWGGGHKHGLCSGVGIGASLRGGRRRGRAAARGRAGRLGGVRGLQLRLGVGQGWPCRHRRRHQLPVRLLVVLLQGRLRPQHGWPPRVWQAVVRGGACAHRGPISAGRKLTEVGNKLPVQTAWLRMHSMRNMQDCHDFQVPLY